MAAMMKKSFDAPEETRSIDKGKVEVVDLHGRGPDGYHLSVNRAVLRDDSRMFHTGLELGGRRIAVGRAHVKCRREAG